MRTLKTTSFETWLKRTNKLMLKVIGINDYSVSVGLQNIQDDIQSIQLYVHCLCDDENKCSIMFTGNIANYNDEAENREVYNKFAETINNIVNNYLKEAA